MTRPANVRSVIHLESKVDETRLLEMFKLFEEFNDYERRLMQAKLARMNRDALYLPPLSLERYGIP